MLYWNIKKFNDLTTRELYELLRLRVDVFVVEQACSYPELDGKDCHPETLHLFAHTEDQSLAAYLRILAPGVSYQDISLGRVVVAKRFRKQGLSHILMKKAIAVVKNSWPGLSITLGAQKYLTSFYKSHGFIPVSDSYLEDNIPHIDMTLNQP